MSDKVILKVEELKDIPLDCISAIELELAKRIEEYKEGLDEDYESDIPSEYEKERELLKKCREKVARGMREEMRSGRMAITSRTPSKKMDKVFTCAGAREVLHTYDEKVKANCQRKLFEDNTKTVGGRRKRRRKRTKRKVIHSWDRARLSREKHKKEYCKKYYKGKYGINKKGCKKDPRCKYVDMGSGGEWCYTKKRAYKKRRKRNLKKRTTRRRRRRRRRRRK